LDEEGNPRPALVRFIVGVGGCRVETTVDRRVGLDHPHGGGWWVHKCGPGRAVEGDDGPLQETKDWSVRRQRHTVTRTARHRHTTTTTTPTNGRGD
jgi:hypothetical protein